MKTYRKGQAPTPEQVRAARVASELTQAEAAQLLYCTTRAFQNYEQPEGAGNYRSMHPGLFELFLLKTGQVRLNGAPRTPKREAR